MKDMKTKGAVAGIVAAILYGGAEMLDHEARIVALEAATGVSSSDSEDLEAQDDLEAQEPPPALGKPGMSAPPIEAPEKDEGEAEED